MEIRTLRYFFSSKSGLKLSPSIRLSLIFFTIRYSIYFPFGFRMVRSSALPGRITSFAFSFLCISMPVRHRHKQG